MKNKQIKNPVIPRQYYSLANTAAELGYPVDYLLHLGAIGAINFSTPAYGSVVLAVKTFDKDSREWRNNDGSDLDYFGGNYLFAYLLPRHIAEIEFSGKCSIDSFPGLCDKRIHNSFFNGSRLWRNDSRYLLSDNDEPIRSDVIFDIRMIAINFNSEEIFNQTMQNTPPICVTVESLWLLPAEREKLHNLDSLHKKLTTPEDKMEASTDFMQHKSSGLFKYNAEKKQAQEAAQAIAHALWAEDTTEAIRIGEMADKVYRHLVGLGKHDALPDTSDSVKDWISSVAPDYARKGGRQKKPV